jgi:hypothetical protein
VKIRIALIVEQQTAPNTGNFILLVLAVCGAIADNRYKARGGKKAPKATVLKLAVAFSIILALFGIREASADSLIYLSVTFFVLGFVSYLRPFSLRYVSSRNSGNACCSCSCVFTTIGPYHVTGSPSGFPETRRNRIPSLPACHAGGRRLESPLLP